MFEEDGLPFPHDMDDFNGTFGGTMTLPGYTALERTVLAASVCNDSHSSVHVYYNGYIRTVLSDHGCGNGSSVSGPPITLLADQDLRNPIRLLAIGDKIMSHVKVYYWKMDSTGYVERWVQGPTLSNSSLPNDEYAFGHSVKMVRDAQRNAWLTVSAPKRNGGPGALHVYKSLTPFDADVVNVNKTWIWQASIDELQIDGESLAIAAPLQYAVMVAFESEGCIRAVGLTRVVGASGSWESRGAPICDNIESSTERTIALSASGNVLAVGSPDAGAGIVRVYYWDERRWSQRGGDLIGVGPGDMFGWSVDLSRSGHTILIGSPMNADVGPQAGRADMFVWLGGRWVQKGEVLKGKASHDMFGWVVSIGDYDEKQQMTFAISSPGHRHAAGSGRFGKVTLFHELDPYFYAQVHCSALGQYGVGDMPPCLPCPYGYSLSNDGDVYFCSACIGSKVGCAGELVVDPVMELINELNATLNALLQQNANNQHTIPPGLVSFQPSISPTRRSRKNTKKPSRHHH